MQAIITGKIRYFVHDFQICYSLSKLLQKCENKCYATDVNNGVPFFSGSNNITRDKITSKSLEGISFDDFKASFGNKSTWEIVRALTVLQVCSYPKIAENSLQLMKWAERLIGVRGMRLLFKPVFYKQFVGGETTEELRSCTRQLARTGLRAMLAATMEEDVGEGGNEVIYNNNCQRILDSIDIVTTENIEAPMIQLKLSGLLSADLLATIGKFYCENPEKISLIKAVAQGINTGKIDATPFQRILNAYQIGNLERCVSRLRKIGTEAKRKGVKVLVDAEYTYLNTGLSLLTMAAVASFNRNSSVIWNTYQCYLKDAEKKLKEELDLVKKLDCFFGAKLVRGAYILQERNRAKKLGTPDPVCDNYTTTCHNYNKILLHLLKEHSVVGPRCQFIIASHNEESIKFAVKKMEDLNLNKEGEGVCFGQLYGMCDQLSNPLMKIGLPVYKSIPYGTIEEVLPYLARRAMENTSILEGAGKELTLLKKELKRRLRSKLHVG